MQGLGVAANSSEGESWLRRAALAGDAEAAILVGNLYARGGKLPPNYAEAATWFRRAAEAGHKGAARALGLLYLTGTGVAPDTEEAAQWFRISAAAGDAAAGGTGKSRTQTLWRTGRPVPHLPMVRASGSGGRSGRSVRLRRLPGPGRGRATRRQAGGALAPQGRRTRNTAMAAFWSRGAEWSAMYRKGALGSCAQLKAACSARWWR
jgi:hypothetical protein